MEHHQAIRLPDSKNFQIVREEYSHELANQSQMLGYRKKGKIISRTTNLSILELLSAEKLCKILPLVALRTFQFYHRQEA